MSVQVITATVSTVITRTLGPPNTAFAGWYVNNGVTGSAKYSPVSCAPSQTWTSDSQYAWCCDIGACATFRTTTCTNNVLAGALTSRVCPSGFTCASLTVFPHTPVVPSEGSQLNYFCATNWVAFSIYKTVLDAISTTQISTFTSTFPTITSTTISSSSPSASSAPSNSNPPQAWISGPIIGAIALIAVVVGLFLFWRRRRNRNHTVSAKNSAYTYVGDPNGAPAGYRYPDSTTYGGANEHAAKMQSSGAGISELPDDRETRYHGTKFHELPDSHPSAGPYELQDVSSPRRG